MSFVILGNSNDVERIYGDHSLFLQRNMWRKSFIKEVERHIFTANDRALHFPRRDISPWQKEVLAFHKTLREIVDESWLACEINR